MANEVRLCFIRPRRPVENGFIESSKGRLRDECLNVEWFSTLEDAWQNLAKFREHYNQQRPHSSLADRTPAAFARSQRCLGKKLNIARARNPCQQRERGLTLPKTLPSFVTEKGSGSAEIWKVVVFLCERKTGAGQRDEAKESDHGECRELRNRVGRCSCRHAESIDEASDYSQRLTTSTHGQNHRRKKPHERILLSGA